MVANVPFNPMITTSALGSFAVQSDGYIQGQAMDDPSARYRLAGGILAASEVLPMWGGVGISETTSPTPAGTGGFATAIPGELGGVISRATLLGAGAGQLTGFSVFDQAHAMVNSPQSPVPVAASGMSVNFYRLGSLARIALQMDPALITAEGKVITTPLSWDFTAQRLIPYSATYPQGTITGAVWANTLGGQIDYTVSTDLTSYIDAGDDINVANVVSTGATTDGYNGNYPVVSISATHIIVAAPRAASPGTYASGGIVKAGGGALPVKVLNVQIGNSMIVAYDPVTGFVTWNRSGACALVQI